MKVKKIVIALLSTIVSTAMLSTSVFALSTGENQNDIEEKQLGVSVDSGISTYITDSDILQLADTSWEDSKSVRTKPTGSTSYVTHTLWSRLGGDICVLKGTGGTYSTYTNHNGTYSNVAYDIIAPGTVFMSANTWVSSSNENSYKDPYFDESTPRAITAEEINTLIADGQPIYIVYNPTTLKVIDFYSVLNPLVAYEWSVVSYT